MQLHEINKMIKQQNEAKTGIVATQDTRNLNLQTLYTINEEFSPKKQIMVNILD